MRTYYSVWRLRMATGLQYRAAALAGVSTQMFFGFLFIMIMAAFYSHASTPAPMSLSEVTAYIWLQQAFLVFIMLWYRDSDIFQLITKGNIAYELCRPCGIYEFWYAKLLAMRLSSALLRCLPILVIAAVLPRPFRLIPPPDAAALLLFVGALVLGLLVLVAISMLIYISVFWTMSPTGSTLLFAVAGEFLAGMVIPVPLMPQWLQQVTYALPFRWTADFPFRVYSGQIGSAEALWGMAAQLGWLFALVTIGKWLLRKALRQVVVQGG
ncbi:ABC transporter permease [Paenibacillus humicola]|uniref:ABC transporter permease n=1 Tax=Paenibacillus humicola TaxID=3110540 RepID=UPI00237AAE25|nr:ABC-2 family transporter protein [Paenibacillus humicola]